MFLPLKNEKFFFRISNNLPSSFHDILVPAPPTVWILWLKAIMKAMLQVIYFGTSFIALAWLIAAHSWLSYEYCSYYSIGSYKTYIALEGIWRNIVIREEWKTCRHLSHVSPQCHQLWREICQNLLHYSFSLPRNYREN